MDARCTLVLYQSCLYKMQQKEILLAHLNSKLTSSIGINYGNEKNPSCCAQHNLEFDVQTIASPNLKRDG